jgi:polysaccharide export outer membrane protein
MMKPFAFRLAAGITACMLALSANSQTAAPPAPVSQPAAPLSAAPAAPRAASTVTAPAGYQLSASDQIAVEVFGEDDLRTAARVGDDGVVTLPLVGPVQIGGLTLSQATARLTELYARDYLVNPRLNVTLISYAKARFTVLGQVNRPGSYEVPEGSPGGVDILEAIAMAGGYTRIAAPERISVRRKGRGGDEVIKVNAKKLARSGSDSSSFRVLPGDRITVGESIF